MAVASYDDLIARVGADYVQEYPFYGETQATVQTYTNNVYSLCRSASVQTLPTLPSGVSGYIVAGVQASGAGFTSPRSLLVAQCVDLGSLDIAGPTFTDGSAFPTETELGASNTTYGPVWMEVTTALNATPGSLTVTYVDQDGNTAETTSSFALPTSNNGLGCAGWVLLNGTDVGVRDITTATRTGGTTPTGVVQFWGVRPVAALSSTGTGSFYPYSPLTQNFNWVKLDAGAILRVFTFNGSTTTAAHGTIGTITIIGDS